MIVISLFSLNEMKLFVFSLWNVPLVVVRRERRRASIHGWLGSGHQKFSQAETDKKLDTSQLLFTEYKPRMKGFCLLSCLLLTLSLAVRADEKNVEGWDFTYWSHQRINPNDVVTLAYQAEWEQKRKILLHLYQDTVHHQPVLRHGHHADCVCRQEEEEPHPRGWGQRGAHQGKHQSHGC